MSKPPPSTPHSDIDGVHQDEELNVKTANEAGQSATSLARAKKHSAGRPNYTDDPRNKDDRTS